MIVDHVLTNSKAYLNGQIVDCSIAIEEGKIFKVGKESQMPNTDEKTDLHNLLVLPGLIDEHVHLRDEGRAYKEDFTTGTAAAAAGGFTTVLDMPNNDPVTMNTRTLENRILIARRKILVNVGFYSEFPKDLAEIDDIYDLGAVGFKLFMGVQLGGLNPDDNQALIEAFEKVAQSNLPVAVHAEDKALLMANQAKLKQSKKSNISDYLRAHTEAVEQTAIQRVLSLSKQSTTKIHFCHVSTMEGLEAIADAKKTGKKVTCEVTPNHLLLTSDDVNRYGQHVIMAPPLRSKLHVEALWKGIEDGLVDTLGSDHAPHTVEEKMSGNIWDVKPGVVGLETTLPLVMTLVKKGRLSLYQTVQLLSEKPAEIYGLTGRGKIEAGKNADLTIVDFNRQYKIDASKFKSKAKFSPYNGWEVWGKPEKTIVNGQLVFENGEVIAKGGVGSVLRSGTTT